MLSLWYWPLTCKKKRLQSLRPNKLLQCSSVTGQTTATEAHTEKPPDLLNQGLGCFRCSRAGPCTTHHPPHQQPPIPVGVRSIAGCPAAARWEHTLAAAVGSGGDWPKILSGRGGRPQDAEGPGRRPRQAARVPGGRRDAALGRGLVRAAPAPAPPKPARFPPWSTLPAHLGAAIIIAWTTERNLGVSSTSSYAAGPHACNSDSKSICATEWQCSPDQH